VLVNTPQGVAEDEVSSRHFARPDQGFWRDEANEFPVEPTAADVSVYNPRTDHPHPRVERAGSAECIDGFNEFDEREMSYVLGLVVVPAKQPIDRMPHHSLSSAVQSRRSARSTRSEPCQQPLVILDRFA
jgi:hypothetical protein